jgi:hypothetical protein
MLVERPSKKQVFIPSWYVRNDFFRVKEVVDRTILPILVTLRKINPVLFENKETMHHGQIGELVSVQNILRSGHKCFGHGLDADIFVDGDPQLGGQRSNDRMLGSATAHVLHEQDHQIIPVGIVAVRQFMRVSAGMVEIVYAHA